jgi:hypothetical protein
MWQDDTDFDVLSVQVSDLLARLMGSEAETIMGYNRNLALDPMCAKALTAGGLAWTQNSLVYNNGYWLNIVPVLNEDILEFWIPLTVGDYRLQLCVLKAPNCGIFRCRVDNTIIGAPSDFNLYAAVNAYNQFIAWDFTITTDGLHRFKVQNVGRDALSTNYYLAVSQMAVQYLPV